MAENKFKPCVDVGKFLTTRYAVDFYLRYIFEYMPTIKDEEVKINLLSSGQVNIYSYYLIEGQVTNGGFVQAFYNGYGKYMGGAIQALEDAGQPECASILRRANEIGGRKILSFVLARLKGLFNSNLYNENETLDQLDNKFYTYTHENDKLFRKYIWNNRSEFMSEKSYSDILEKDIAVLNHENGQIYQRYSLEANGIEGWYDQYDTNGNISLRKQFLRGVPTGASEEFYEAGNLKVTTSIEEGKLIRMEYYTDGPKKSLKTLDCSSEKADGLYIAWFNNGNINYKGYSKGYLGYGKKEHFYEDGQVRMIGTMKGYDFIMEEFYLPDGTQTLRDGSGFTKATNIVDEGEKVRTDEYKNGVRDGDAKTYINGKLVSIESYRNGSLTSQSKGFDQD